jgi:peptide/nickel transport system ATP-binding protein
MTMEPNTNALLQIESLSVSFRSETGIATPVRGVSLSVKPGETLAIVGESGSGKSVASLAVMGLLPKPSGFISGGSIRYRTRQGEMLDLGTMPLDAMRRLRGTELAMIFQEPMTSLNPVLTVGEQIAEAVRLHLNLDRGQTRKRVRDMLDLVEIPDAGRRMDDYPHQMSGGMRQRVMIALAMSCNPALLIADEPTTALDVTIQAQILALIDRLRRETGMAVLFITHNLGVVSEIADRVAVMYAGQVVESGITAPLFRAPRHPYTDALLSCLPARAVRRDGRRIIQAIAGQPGDFGPACAFAPRCPMVRPACHETAPELEQDEAGDIRCLRWREQP